MKGMYKELIELVNEYGQPITIKDYETWEDVKAYGTYQLGNDEEPKPYVGRFGKGYTVKSHNSESTRFCFITYYVA